jgi:hypothetical protein
VDDVTVVHASYLACLACLTNTNALNSLTSDFKRPEAALTPPAPGEPVPSVPPVEKADGSPLRYGGLRTASSAVHTL